MGVTAIKSIANRTSGTTYHIRNLANLDDTGGVGQYLEIAPGENRRVNMWIPWCDNQIDFGNDKRILFEALGTIEQEMRRQSRQALPGDPESFTIWQSGDYVYLSLDDRFETGQLVAGRSTVNGDRSVEIANGTVYFY